MFCQKSKFGVKVQMLCQKSKFFVKNGNVLSKIQILSQNLYNKFIYFQLYQKALQAKENMIEKFRQNFGENNIFTKEALRSSPRLTQENFDTKKIMFMFHKKATQFIEQHVNQFNPRLKMGAKREKLKNKPFFLYLSFRAPHKPYSHNVSFTGDDIDRMPYATLGKPGKKI